ncbi:MAG TPA: hypothetical protein VFJ02_06635 [Vicinamibacterales bacterium]|nr:hypothetical protein [Vicinamibacterales bacterium]
MLRSRLAHGLDWLALALAVAAFVIAVTGGTVLRIGGMRITARSPERALVAAIAVIALRVAVDRRTRPLSSLPPFARRVRALLYDPRLDDVATLPDDSRWRRRLVALAGLTGVAAVLLFPQLRQLYSVPDLGDPLFSIWRVGWVFHKLHGDPRPLFSPNIFYPHELTFTYSDSMLLPALTTVPLLLAGLHPVVAYNLALVGSFIASGFAMYLLAERLTGSAKAAFVSALLFGFYPYRFEHYSHFELQMTYCMPLALLALHAFIGTARVRHAVAAGLLAAGQLYCSMYYAVFFTLYAGWVFVLSTALRRVPIRRLVLPAVLAAVLAIALAWPLAKIYSAARLGDREPATVEYYSATAADYLRAHPRSATWGERTLPGRQPERALFPGLVILILAAVALVPPIGTTRTVYAAALLLIFEISRGFNSPIYPPLYEWLSFVRGLRVPARASILVGLSLALLAGFGVRRLLAGRPRRLAQLAMTAIVVAVALDLRPLLRLEPVWREPPPVYGAIAGDPSVVLAEFPIGGAPRTYTANVPFMYFSLWHWANMVNGYSGHYPPGQVEYEEAFRTFPDPATVALLRARHVTHVTITCALYRSSCDELLARVDATPDFRLVTAGKWEEQPVRLYELRR